MLEKPDLPDERLIAGLRDDFGLDIARVTFLPLGSDVDTAVYRADGKDGPPFFAKLRRGPDDGTSVKIAQLLYDRGIEQIIAPIRAHDGRLWAPLDEFTLTLSPFVAGQDGFARDLRDEHWITLGDALKAIHSTPIPADLWQRLPVEGYPDQWRGLVRMFQIQAEDGPFPDSVAEQLADLMREKRVIISRLVAYAEQFAEMMSVRKADMVPCHADIHGGNVLLDDRGRLYIVDWDTFMIAPKERDLMFIGGGIGRGWRGEDLEALFYQGYGETDIDLTAIAYYRCERIVQDFAEFGKQLLLSRDGGADREQSLYYFASNFQPGGVIEIALESVERAQI